MSNQARFEQLQQHGHVLDENLSLVTSDGRKIAVKFVSNEYQAGDRNVILGVFRSLIALCASAPGLTSILNSASVIPSIIQKPSEFFGERVVGIEGLAQSSYPSRHCFILFEQDRPSQSFEPPTFSRIDRSMLEGPFALLAMQHASRLLMCNAARYPGCTLGE